MIYNLQALRALAAWMVVAHHLRGPLGQIWPPMGETLVFAAGVDLFFVLSGYVMVASTRGRSVSSMAFWRRRFVRVAPLYWLITTVIFAALLAGLSPIGVASWDWRDVVASYTFVGMQRSDGYPGPLLGVGWTLAYEAFFYLVFGVALLLRTAPVVTISALMATLAIAGVLIAPEGFIQAFYTSPILLEFAAGAIVAHLRLTRHGAVFCMIGAIGLVYGALSLSALAPSGDLITPGGSGALWRTLCFGAPAALIVAGVIAMERSGRRFRNALVLDQGDASYALYLIHLPMIQVIDKLTGGGAAMLVIATPVLWIASHLIHQWWERPLLSACRPRCVDLRAYRLAG